jgi:alpha-galactosidase
MNAIKSLIRVVVSILVLARVGPLIVLAAPGPQRFEVHPADSSHPLWRSLQQQAGFSVQYKNLTVGPVLPPGWTVRPSTPGPQSSQVFIEEPGGLQVIRDIREYPEFDAVEYTLRLRNTGRTEIPPITELNSIDLTVDVPDSPDAVVYTAHGGTWEPYFPPLAFTLHRLALDDSFIYALPLRLEAAGGRSSNMDFPFFAVVDESRQMGFFVGIGWSGQWRVDLDRDSRKRTLRIHGGIPSLDLSLAAGEQISSPHILLLSYHGDFAEGCNKLRRLIYQRFTPLLDGRKPEPLAFYDQWFGAEPDIDEHLSRQRADIAAELGQELFLLEPGWIPDKGLKGAEFSMAVGNWNEENRVRFPSGVKAFADYVRSKGMQFGLWFEPERAWKGSWMATQHPDWVISLPRSPNSPKDLREDVLDPDNERLVDFGLPAVRAWAEEFIDRKIGEYGIKYLRWDFNTDPLPYWEFKDRARPHRGGITQIRHIEGLYEVIDWLRERHPAVIFEGCASGGRRIDLEMIRRSHTFWLSDQSTNPHEVRHIAEGAHYFLPGNYLIRLFVEESAGKPFPDIDYLSRFGSYFGFSGKIESWTPEMRRQARHHFDVQKPLRRYLLGDYYPLFDQPSNLDAWDGAQYHDPQSQEGFLLVFRLSSGRERADLHLRGIEPGATYEFRDPYTGQAFRQLGSEPVVVELERMSGKVLVYKEVTKAAAR